jgi:hypothetical protein
VAPGAGKQAARTLARGCSWGLVAIALGCGSRTGLLLDAPPADASLERDAATDAFAQDVQDAGVEAGAVDAMDEPDVTVVTPPGCVNAAPPGIYVITRQRNMWRFDPPTAHFTLVGPIQCPGTGALASMAVARTGAAYVEILGGQIARVSTTSAQCDSTGFHSVQGFASEFGMGFSADPVDGGETLYIAESFRNFPRLASLDTTTFALRVIGTMDSSIMSPELTGSGGGDLFAFYQAGPTGSKIGKIDRLTAKLLSFLDLPGISQGIDYAFAFWGGDFYLFTVSPLSSGSDVTRVRPSDGSVVVVAHVSESIVGAGVSTCAPLSH